MRDTMKKILIKAIEYLANQYVRLQKKHSSIEPFSFDPKLNISEDIKAKYGFSGDLLDIFVSNRAQVVHKWHHYIPIYDRYFSRFRKTPVRILEIGVSEGGSLQMWRKYFGPDAIIFGIDINPECKKFDGVAGNVRIGSQVDFDFLESVLKEMGGIDIVLDDGSHMMTHIHETLNFIYPKVAYGGIYMIEDLHTAFWPEFGGGLDSSKNFFTRLQNEITTMHRWYHGEKLSNSVVGLECGAIHVHDSIVVFEKEKSYKPTHSRIG